MVGGASHKWQRAEPVRDDVIYQQAAGSSQGAQHEERVVGEASKAVGRQQEHLGVDASAGAAAVLSPGTDGPRQTMPLPSHQGMEVDAFDPLLGKEERVVSRPP